jgi:hypothetical protein
MRMIRHSRDRWAARFSTVASVGLGLTFLCLGAAKLLAMPVFTEAFAAFALPRWALVPVGLFEGLTGALLLHRVTRFFGALGVCAAMMGAASVHLMSGVMLPAIFVNAALFALAAWLASRSGTALRALNA